MTSTHASVRCSILVFTDIRSVFLLALLSVSGNTHAVSLLHASCCSGCSYCEASGAPLSESSPSPRKHKKKKVSVAARQSVHPSERSPTLPSSSGLCVRQIENEQQSTVGEVSQPLKVMALASRLAGPDNAVPSLLGSDSWLSSKKPKKNSELVSAPCTSRCSQATF